MKFKLIAAGCMAAVLCGAGAAMAESKWSGNAELGIVSTGGNTETRNINAKAKTVNDRDAWRHTGTFEALNTSDGTRTTAERYLVTAKSDWKINEYDYLFGLAGYDKDRFSGFDYRVSETLGYGRRLIMRDRLTLDAEIGAGARQSKEEATGNSDNELLGRAAANLDWKISDTAGFAEALTVDVGESATITRSVSSLTNQLAGRLQSKISFTFKNTTGTPPGVKENDYETAITLVYNFGE